MIVGARKGAHPAGRPDDANTKTVVNVQTSIVKTSALQRFRARPHGLPAAVMRDGEAGAENIARVVPRRAQLVRVGNAVAGYWLSPAKAQYRFSFRSRRVREIEFLASLRYQNAPPPPEAARALAIAVAGHSEPNAAIAWINRWCVTLDHDEQEQIITDAATKRRFWRADAIASLLDVTKHERDVLGLRTIGAIDCDKRQRTIARKQRDRDRKRAARAASAKPRSLSLEKAAPWAVAGISRATWYRRKKRNVASRKTGSVHNICINSIADVTSLMSATSGPATAAARVAALVSGNTSVASLIEQTGLTAATLRPVLSRLVKRGRLVIVSRGLYRATAPEGTT